MSLEANLTFTAKTSQRKASQRHCGGRALTQTSEAETRRSRHVTPSTDTDLLCTQSVGANTVEGREVSGELVLMGESVHFCVRLCGVSVCADRRGHRYVTLRPKWRTT